MSLTAKRQEFADALSMVDGVHGYPYPPNPLREGDAWPVGPSLDRQGGTAFEATWAIRVVAPQDERAAAEWFDGLWPDVFTALERVAFVDRAAPIRITNPGQPDLLAFEITARAEE